MSRPLCEVIAEVLARPEGDRHDLADAIGESLEPDDKADEDYPFGPGWAAEIRRRLEAIDAGDSQGVPLSEAMRLIMSDDEEDGDDAAG